MHKREGKWLARMLKALALWIVCTQSGSILAADRALLIGINDYSHGGFTPLSGALNDVQAMSRLLRDGFGLDTANIKTLTDQQATRKGILDAMDHWLIEGSSENDRVFFYYSGHGYYQLDTDGDESGPDQDGRDEVLVAADADCSEGLSKCTNFILDDEIGERLDKLQGRSVFVMIDSCHSGTVTRDQGVSRGLPTRKLSKQAGSTRSLNAKTDIPVSSSARAAHRNEVGFIEGTDNMVALFAVSSYQEAPEVTSPDLPGGSNTVGFFTDRIVRGLLHATADSSGDGDVSFAELLSYAREEGKLFCEQNPSNGACRTGVTPVFEVNSEWQGQAVLGFGKTHRVNEPMTPPVQNSMAVESIENILAHGNDAGLSLAIASSNDNKLKVGENLTLNIMAERAGLLVVLDLDANGKLSRLYPSSNGVALAARPDGKPAGWVKPGYKVVMPDAYAGAIWPVSPPYGKGRLIALLVEDAEQVAKQIGATRAFEIVQRPVQQMGELRETLNTLVPEDDISSRVTRWSVTQLEYEIVQ